MLQHISRRRFLQIGAASTLAAVALPHSLVGSAQAAEAPASTSASGSNMWTFEPQASGPTLWESPVLEAGFTFDSCSANWQVAAGDVSVDARVLDTAGVWSDWIHLHADSHAPDFADGAAHSALLLGQGTAVQVRASVGAGDVLHALRLHADSVALPEDAPLPEATALIDGFIVPRAGWGADEKLRYKDQDTSKYVLWPPEYATIRKIIIHHTATTNNPPDPAAAIRSIYRYHAIEQGWGDIGYNFMIDANGVVYEGRFGGPNVVGGHSLTYNSGSIGICLLGDFDQGEPTDAALDAVLQVIWARAAHVDVTTSSDFKDLLRMPNLCGHGDLMPTSCPGTAVEELLPYFRGWVVGSGPIYLDPPIRPEALEIRSFTIGPATVYRGNLLQVRAVVRNTGQTTLTTSGPNPGFIYDERQNYVDVGEPKIQNAHRICLDYVGNGGMTRPWRWGLGSPLAPGEERVITGYVRMYAPGTWTYFGSVLKENVSVIADNLARTAVRTAGAPVQPASAWGGNDGRYFSETEHNVPPAFIRFWDQYGGLRRFGYPLTEPFDEVSETDGGTYLTQYFERARFEYHPEYAGTVDAVQLGLLGAEKARARRNETPFQRVSDPRQDGVLYFSETGHTLRNRFRAVWEARGGLRIFGYPISEPFDERSATDGQWHTVQYFERNRFEYHPDYAGTDDEVMLGHLGREVLIFRGWIEGA